MSKSRKLTFCASLAAHAGAIALLVLVIEAPESGAVAPAPVPIDLFLPPMMTAARTIDVPETAKPVETAEPVEIEEPQEITPPEPETVTVPIVPDAVEAVEPEVAVAKEPEPEKPKPKPRPRREADKKPPKPKEPPAPAPPPSVASGPPDAPIGPVATPGNAPVTAGGGGDPGAVADYTALVGAWVKKHKFYPERARRREMEGRPSVRFRIDRAGTVLSCELVQSSGRSELDEAALETIRRADPFPAMPDDVSGDTKEFTVTVDFSINRRR